MTDPIGEVDQAVDQKMTALVPDVRPPAVRRRDAVLVTGPWLAGSSSVLAALAERMPDVAFVESDHLRPGEVPVAVVFVASAAAPLTASDCAVLDAAAAHTDLVIGALSKTDAHRNWRAVLEANRETLQRHSARFGSMPWVGVAAAPDLGEPRCTDLVESLAVALAEESVPRRNRLRAWEFRIRSSIEQYHAEVDGAGREARTDSLQRERAEAGREARAAKSQRVVALRSQIQQARVQLSYFARNRCNSVRTELQEDAAEVTRRGMPQFLRHVGQRVDTVVDEVDAGITEHLRAVADELGLPVDRTAPKAPERPEVGVPPLRSRHLETRLMVLVGAGFGLGIALTLSRLFADLAPGLAALGGVGCALIGVLAAVWMVRTRALLHDRAVLDRWIAELSARLRAAVDQAVVTRVLAAEMSLTSALTERVAADQQRVTRRIESIDAELRQHAVQRAQAAAARDRALPALRAALATVHTELGQHPSSRTNGHHAGTPNGAAQVTGNGRAGVAPNTGGGDSAVPARRPVRPRARVADPTEAV